jgi:hypothetical protein
MMTAKRPGAGRTWHRRHAALIAASAATAAAAAVAATAAAAAVMIAPVSSALAQSGAPAGWAAVPYARAQLSVPGSWLVETPQQVGCPLPGLRSPGMIFAGGPPEIPTSAGCGLTASLAWIRPAGHIPRGIRHRRPSAVIHGIAVFRLPSGPHTVLYLAPALDVRVGARGPLARRVLATLSYSPLAVVLRRGPASPVPGSWLRHHFGGLRFAAPPSWSVQRESQWATCGTGLVPSSLLLIDATRPPAALPCPYPLPTAAAEQAEPGLTVVTGKYAARSVAEHFARCQLRHGVRICLSSVTGQGGLSSSVLIFSASRPHRPGATFFVLGLSGSGARARAILSSIGATGH